VTPAERRCLRALLRITLADKRYSQMGGIYIYAVADERTAAWAEVEAAAAELDIEDEA
jgi:hypothetical protein